MSYRVQIFAFSCIASLLFLVMPQAFAQDAYTDALNAEAETLSVDPGSSTQQQKQEQTGNAGGSFASSWSRDAQAFEDNLPLGLGKADFEDALQEIYYGSYIFYKRLTPTQQETVFTRYRENISIDELRALIVELKRLK
jgi:hypothetical protein